MLLNEWLIIRSPVANSSQSLEGISIRVLIRALFVAAAMSATTVAFACPGGPAHEAEVIALTNEPILLNGEAGKTIESLELVEELHSPSWDDIDVLPSPIGLPDLQPLRVVVDDEGIPLVDVAVTGSTHAGVEPVVARAEMAIDGLEDR